MRLVFDRSNFWETEYREKALCASNQKMPGGIDYKARSKLSENKNLFSAPGTLYFLPNRQLGKKSLQEKD
jgi:hypothetical protein